MPEAQLLGGSLQTGQPHPPIVRVAQTIYGPAVHMLSEHNMALHTCLRCMYNNPL